jgi:hypothetical protein
MAYYPQGCDENISAHVCGTCGDELSRVRGVAFINESYYAAIAANPDDISVWNAGIATGDIRVIPETQGEYDGGNPNMGQGYGDVEEKLNSYTFTLTYMDPTYIGNQPFYNEIKRSLNWYVAFRSETVLAISDEPCVIVPQNPIANDLKVERVWNVQVKWTSENFPDEVITPDGLFTCYVP